MDKVVSLVKDENQENGLPVHHVMQHVGSNVDSLLTHIILHPNPDLERASPHSFSALSSLLSDSAAEVIIIPPEKVEAAPSPPPTPTSGMCSFIVIFVLTHA